MATTVHVYVDPDAAGSANGNDWTNAYTSLNAAETARDADIVSADQVMVFHCRSSSGTADTTAVSFAGWTTDDTRYIEVICDDDETYGHNRHSGKWDTSKYRLEVTDAIAISTTTPYIRFTGLQIKTVSPTAANRHGISYLGASDTNDVRITKCIIQGHGDATYAQAGILSGSSQLAVFSIWNSVIYNISTNAGSTCIQVYSAAVGSSRISNCTLSGGAWGLRVRSGTVYAKNVAALGSATADFLESAGTLYCVNCASEDLTADDQDGDGTSGNNQTEQTFSFVNTAAGDYHLQATDTGAIDLGADLTSDTLAFTDDIDGVTRSGTWDIGADEYVASGGSTSYTSTILATLKRRRA